MFDSNIALEKQKATNRQALEDANIRVWLKEQVADITGGATGIVLSPSDDNDKLPPDVLKEAYNQSVGTRFFTFNNDLQRAANAAVESVIKEEYSLMYKELMARLDKESIQTQSAFNRNFRTMTIEEIFKTGGLTDGISIDLNEYLDGDYRLDFMFETNFPFFNRHIGEPVELLQGVYRNDREGFEIDAYNVINMLVVQQGYSITELFNPAARAESAFLTSVEREFMPWSGKAYSGEDSGVKMVAALATFNGNEFVDFINEIRDRDSDKEKSIILPQDTVIGLFNPKSGKGSYMGITLDKPAEIPESMLQTIEFEGADTDSFTVGKSLDISEDSWKHGVEYGEGSISVTELDSLTRKLIAAAYNNVVEGEKRQNIKKKAASASLER